MDKVIQFPKKYRPKRKDTPNETLSEEVAIQDQLSFFFTTDCRRVQPRQARDAGDPGFEIGPDPSDHHDSRGRR